MKDAVRYALVFLAIWSIAAQAQPSGVVDCQALYHHGKLAEAQSCFGNLLRSTDPFARAEGYLGLGAFRRSETKSSVLPTALSRAQ